MFVVTLLMVFFTVAEIQFLAAERQSSESYCALLVELARDQRVTQDDCGILRGPRDRREIALIFTGGSFAEGYADVHRALTALNVKASFFFTGDFLRTDEFQPLVQELLSEGHYIGPHSDRHLTLVDDNGQTLVPRNVFDSELRNNLMELARSGVDIKNISFWIPPDETYNREICEWSFDLGIKLFNYSPGTYSNKDYLGDHESGFAENETIEKSILDLAARPDGLNGFLLLLHLGVGPERTVPFSTRLPALLPQLAQMGYNFVRVDEMLAPELARSIGRRRGDR